MFIKAIIVYLLYYNYLQTSFIDTIPKTLAKNEQIQLGFLLTSSTSEEGGLSFGEIKEKTNFLFDIITLRSNVESDPDEAEKDYEEVVEGLKNVVWSNVKFGSG